MTIWRHVVSLGPFPWQPGQDYTMREVSPGLFGYEYRPCACRDPRFYRPGSRPWVRA
jgi:hypothetical protein